MIKPKGGRGKKAPYETVAVRVPVPLLETVTTLIEQYRQSVLDPDNAVNSTVESEDCLSVLNRFIEESGQSDKLHTRNNVNLLRFRDWLQVRNSPTESDTL